VFAEELDRLPNGPRRYRLGLAETTYNRWAATANALDEQLGRYRTLTQRLGSDTLRQAWGHAPDCLEDLADLPAPCLVGVCVVVIVKDEIVVVSRQRKHYVAGAEPSSTDRSRQRTPVHFVGEGTEPEDFMSSRIPPDEAALRGCFEEMRLDAKDVDLIPTAFVFDTLRWQPLFCYLAYCKLTLSEVETRMKKAKDSRETGGGQIAKLLSPTVTDADTRALLTGSHPSMRLASNHAEIALLYALVYLDGLERIASETLGH
jgi:ADP-ribose pyrophosphatase YjhB (NUDIX family)